MKVTGVIERPLPFGIAVVGVVLSGMLSFFMLTPMGWGMSWSELAPTWSAKFFFLAPVVALIVAGIANFLRPWWL